MTDLVLACRDCPRTQGVQPDLHVNGVPIADWWDQQGQRCSRCRGLAVANRPGRSHRDGLDTEHAAAESVRDVTGRLRSQVLALLEAHPDGLTDDEGGALMDGDRLTFGRRRNELVGLNRVVDSGRRRRTPRGRAAAVWVLV